MSINLSSPVTVTGSPIVNLNTQFDSQYKEVNIVKKDDSMVKIFSNDDTEKKNLLPFSESWQKEAIQLLVMAAFSSHGIETSGYKLWVFRNAQTIKEHLGNITLKITPNSNKGIPHYQAKIAQLVDSVYYLGQVLDESMGLYPPTKVAMKEGKVKPEDNTPKLNLFDFA